jgi:hypothetical protein
MPAYYLRSGETIAENVRRMSESRVVRTGFGRTAIVSKQGEWMQWLLLRSDGAPVVEECGMWQAVPFDAFVTRLAKSSTIEETRNWPEVTSHERVLGWIESKDFPPVPETTVMRAVAVMGPNAGRPVVVVARTTYVGPLDEGAKFEGVPKELKGQTIEVMDLIKRTVERHYPDGRIEPIENVVDWDAQK